MFVERHTSGAWRGAVTITAYVRRSIDPSAAPLCVSRTLTGSAVGGFGGDWQAYEDYLRGVFLDTLRGEGLQVVEGGQA